MIISSIIKEQKVTCTTNQVRVLMTQIKIQPIVVAAAKAGMDAKTARKYLSGKLPDEIPSKHNWQNRKDPFEQDWPGIESFLLSSPNIQAKVMLEHLISKHPERYQMQMLRTLQRRFKSWRVENGKPKAVIFPQIHQPGLQSQSDYTVMNSLNITIAGKPFKHLLFHFMLVYSRWEHVSICYSESFDSLLHGFEEAVCSLGSVACEHRTDNLTAATKKVSGGSREFTARWQQVMKHYKIRPSRNNPGESHENGSIEKSHDLYKTAVEQMLILRGSRDFSSIEKYNNFLKELTASRNAGRRSELAFELPTLRKLPNDKWSSPKVIPVRVSPSSVVQIDKIPYSVPSRLISCSLKAHIYQDKIELYYGQRLIHIMVKQTEQSINYRHIIDSLIRKPGAFKNYQYREALFPSIIFKKAYEALEIYSPVNGHKDYLRLLQLAKLEGEQAVSEAIKLLTKQQRIPLPKDVSLLLPSKLPTPAVTVNAPKLDIYNQLLMAANKETML